MQSMTWSVVFMDEKVREALDDFPLDIRGSFQRIVELIQSHGLERKQPPGLKPRNLKGSVSAGLKTRSPGLKVRGFSAAYRVVP
jgi:hypothetical protein